MVPRCQGGCICSGCTEMCLLWNSGDGRKGGMVSSYFAAVGNCQGAPCMGARHGVLVIAQHVESRTTCKLGSIT